MRTEKAEQVNTPPYWTLMVSRMEMQNEKNGVSVSPENEQWRQVEYILHPPIKETTCFKALFFSPDQRGNPNPPETL